ncbi:hypothetical protein ACFSKN_03335 [Mariniflexile gromovii]|uniref:SnoaL-like protein n=1 Tax=Mariniflexile gromovii TaxID=362523 RepID=A0ABS4BU74_9FLAO|nr:hypothetical protein [Mariniflexile gromovii]MBP0903597.1 hypothetical protein [Mariniflexile gromovii]
MMKKLFLLILISLGTSATYSQGKSKEKEAPKDYSENVLTINSTINTLYATISGEKGKKRDWALFKYLFHPDGKLITSGKNDESKFQIRYMKPDDYIKSSGKWIVDNGFIEKEVHRTVDAFGNIAHVFSTFESFHSKTDEEPFMRGINSIQLLNDGTRWWIVNVFWDNENRRNPIPRNYLPK